MTYTIMERIHITEVTNREDGSQVVRGFIQSVGNVGGVGVVTPGVNPMPFERTLTGSDRDAFMPGSDYDVTYTLVERTPAAPEVATPRAAE